jgi:hypothetical protein
MIYPGVIDPSAGGFTMRVVRTLLPGSSVQRQYDEPAVGEGARAFDADPFPLTDDATPAERNGRA